MSQLTELKNNLAEKLPQVIETYEAALNNFKDNLEIKGKLLEHANREQASWISYYDERRVELHTLVKYLEARVESVRGKLFRQYTENYSRELSDRAKEKYIDHEHEYLSAYTLCLEVKELYEKYESAVKSFDARGYALNNITKIRVASLEDVVI